MPYMVSFFFTLYNSCHLIVCADMAAVSIKAHKHKISLK